MAAALPPSRAASLAALACLAASARVAAQPRPVAAPRARLEYVRGAGTARCPDETEVRDAVSARLGYVPFHPEAPARLRATVTRRGPGYHGRIELVDAGGALAGEREVASRRPDCAELLSAMTLAISIAVDALPAAAPVRTAPPAPAPAPAAATPAPAPAPREPRPVTPATAPGPEPSRAERISALFGLGVAVTAGALPSIVPGVTAAVGLRWRALSVAVEGRLDAPATAGGGGAQADLRLLTGALVPCVQPVPSQPWGLCGYASVGWLSGEGRGVDQPRSDGSVVIAAGARAVLDVPLHRLVALRFHGEAGVAARRGVAQLDGAVIWEAPAVQGGAGASAVARFP